MMKQTVDPRVIIDHPFAAPTRQSSKQRNERHRRMLRDRAAEIKAKGKCLLCGHHDPDCLDFHHIDPSSKSFDISRGIFRGVPLHRLLSEISLCVILCANCHRQEERAIKQGYTLISEERLPPHLRRKRPFRAAS